MWLIAAGGKITLIAVLCGQNDLDRGHIVVQGNSVLAAVISAFAIAAHKHDTGGAMIIGERATADGDAAGKLNGEGIAVGVVRVFPAAGVGVSGVITAAGEILYTDL